MKLFRVSLLVISIIIVYSLISSKSVGAKSIESWSWTDAKPIVFRSEKVVGVTQYTCPIPYQMRDVSGKLDPRKICVTQGNNISFGNTSYFSWGEATKFVGFSYDGKMYNFKGPCAGWDGCLYLPDTDTLVTKQILTGYTRSLVIYKNFKKRLSKIFNGFYTEYDFDSSNPDYVFQSKNGNPWTIGGMGVSDDGKWLAVELIQRGFGLLNIETLQMKKISTMIFHYGYGYDPTSELAVSNGGHQVAIMGMNAGLTVYDVDQSCGEEVTDEKMYLASSSMTNPCKKADIYVSDFINRFYMATNPRFTGEGGELDFYSIPYTGEERDVALRAHDYGGSRLDYLALGDSYSSGEGELEDKHYLPGTNEKFEKCHISNRSYPFVVAKISKIDTTFVKSVACSGAETKDVIGNEAIYSGQKNRLKEDKLNFSDMDKLLAKQEGLYKFIPGRSLQEDFVVQYAPKIITIGIGGNDAGLMDKLRACVALDTCSWAVDAQKKEQTAKEIKNIYAKLVSTYQKLHRDSPGSKIYVIGYPKVIDENGKCDALLEKMLVKTERNFMNESIKYLNQIVEQAARAAGVNYIDIYDIFGDQLLCGSKTPAAMNGIRTGDELSPIGDSDWFRFIGSESFHPTPTGHKLIADKVARLIDSTLSYSYCSDDAASCPDLATKAPDPKDTGYWMPEGIHDYPSLKKSDFVSDCTDSQCSSDSVSLKLDSYSLSPESEVDVEINSESRHLGKFVASSDGSLLAVVKLPNDLGEGYHTIHILGKSFSDEAIDLYQVIGYKIKYNTADSDNGIYDMRTESNSIDAALSVSLNASGTKITPNPAGSKSNFQSNIARQSEVKGVSTRIPNHKQRKSIQGLASISLAFVFLVAALAVVIFVITKRAIRKRKFSTD